MNQYKHICDLAYCSKHQECMFKNATSILKSSSYIVALGEEDYSNRILCYQKEDIGFGINENKQVIKRVEDSDDSWNVHLLLSKNRKELCENPKCKLGNPVSEIRHNGDINLCKSCNDFIHKYKTNHELALYFNSKTKIIKLLSCIRELEKENNENKNEVIRCANIYCGTLFNITKHHLIPKPYRKGLVTPVDKIPLCEDCHKKVHRLATNKELAKHYNTKESVIGLLAGDVQFRVERILNVYENTSAMVA